jgi:hypothetical protein
MTRHGDEGEQLFESYLRDRGLTFDYERTSGRVHPDFWVTSDVGTIVCEVCTLSARPPVGGSAIDVYEPIRTAINRKRRQGREVKGELPYVLVLHAPSWPTDDIAISGAMLGNVGISMPFDPSTGTADMDEATTRYLAGGRLQPRQNTRFSALVVVHRFNPGRLRLDRALRGKPRDLPLAEAVAYTMRVADELAAHGLLDDDEWLPRVDVFHNPWALTALPDGVFAGPRDRVYADQGGSFGLIAEGVELEGFEK